MKSLDNCKKANNEIQATKGNRLWESIKKFREGNLILIIVAVCAIMSILSPYFLTWENIKATILSFATDGIVVIGMTVILVLGGLDLSVGSVMCLAMVVAGKLFLYGVNPWVASVLAVIAAGLVGLINGFFVTKVGLSYFITTLAMMGIARGFCFVVTKGTPLSLFELPDSFKFIGAGSIWLIPFAIILFLVVCIISDYMLRYSTVLRKIFYIGSNEKAAVFSGINIQRMKIGVCVLSAVLSGVAGIIYMSRFAVATPGFGSGLEMTAISAAVIGGASLNGGKGSVLGAVLGVALLGIITSSLILLNVSVYWQDLIKGIILLGAVSWDHIRQKEK
jgi:ribose transport system permease protein